MPTHASDKRRRLTGGYARRRIPDFHKWPRKVRFWGGEGARSVTKILYLLKRNRVLRAAIYGCGNVAVAAALGLAPLLVVVGQFTDQSGRASIQPSGSAQTQAALRNGVPPGLARAGG